MRTDNPEMGGEGTVSRGTRPPLDETLSRLGDLVRPLTPLTAPALVALYGIAAVVLGMVWPGGVTVVVAGARLVAPAGPGGAGDPLVPKAGGGAGGGGAQAPEGPHPRGRLRSAGGGAAGRGWGRVAAGPLSW